MAFDYRSQILTSQMSDIIGCRTHFALVSFSAFIGQGLCKKGKKAVWHIPETIRPESIVSKRRRAHPVKRLCYMEGYLAIVILVNTMFVAGEHTSYALI